VFQLCIAPADVWADDVGYSDVRSLLTKLQISTHNGPADENAAIYGQTRLNERVKISAELNRAHAPVTTRENPQHHTRKQASQKAWLEEVRHPAVLIAGG
jgi:uncharacterized protein YecT (DUF1311 family)